MFQRSGGGSRTSSQSTLYKPETIDLMINGGGERNRTLVTVQSCLFAASISRSICSMEHRPFCNRVSEIADSGKKSNACCPVRKARLLCPDRGAINYDRLRAHVADSHLSRPGYCIRSLRAMRLSLSARRAMRAQFYNSRDGHLFTFFDTFSLVPSRSEVRCPLV
jgi:hypothetical protein